VLRLRAFNHSARLPCAPWSEGGEHSPCACNPGRSFLLPAFVPVWCRCRWECFYKPNNPTIHVALSFCFLFLWCVCPAFGSVARQREAQPQYAFVHSIHTAVAVCVCTITGLVVRCVLSSHMHHHIAYRKSTRQSHLVDVDDDDDDSR
jgi:hypothetical protein